MFIPFMILLLVDRLDKQENFNGKFEKLTGSMNEFIENYLSLSWFNLKQILNKSLFNQYLFEFEILRNLMDFIIQIKN